MINRLLTGGVARAIMILGVTFFAVYGIIALILGKTGHGDLQAQTAAVMGYLFIAGIAALWVYERRRLRRDRPALPPGFGAADLGAGSDLLGVPDSARLCPYAEGGKPQACQGFAEVDEGCR